MKPNFLQFLLTCGEATAELGLTAPSLDETTFCGSTRRAPNKGAAVALTVDGAAFLTALFGGTVRVVVAGRLPTRDVDEVAAETDRLSTLEYLGTTAFLTGVSGVGRTTIGTWSGDRLFFAASSAAKNFVSI